MMPSNHSLPDFREDLVNAIRDLTSDDIAGFQGSAHLAELSSNTQVEDVEVLEDEIIEEDGIFRVPANLYVSLSYHDSEGDELFHSTFPGSFIAEMEDGRPVIRDMAVDTSSFFE